MDESKGFPRMDQHLLRTSLLVSPHIRPLEPSTLAPRAWRPGYSHGEFGNTLFFNEGQLYPNSYWHSASLPRFPGGGVLVYHGVGSAVQFRHHNVITLDCPGHESF